MKIWFDTEFIENGTTIDLISIGMINEKGQKLYLESSECDLSKSSPWVKNNVLPHLTGHLVSREYIAAEIKAFAGPNPEFWAYYADYDWVALCQLYGTMMDLPDNWPRYCRDLKQVIDEKHITTIPKQSSSEHNALNDAVWLKETHNYVTNYRQKTLGPHPTHDLEWRDSSYYEYMCRKCMKTDTTNSWGSLTTPCAP